MLIVEAHIKINHKTYTLAADRMKDSEEFNFVLGFIKYLLKMLLATRLDNECDIYLC